jgi:outer membrane receptor protein involved in Fe transport
MLFGSYGYNSDGRRFTGINDRERFDLQHQRTGVTEQDLAGATVNRGHNLTGNAELRIGRRDVLSQALVANVRTAGEDSRLSVVERDGALVPGERYLRPRRTDTDGLLLDWTTAWRRTLAPRRHELAAEVRLNRTVDTERNGFARRSADGGTLLEAEAFDLDARATQLTAQVDYTRPLGGATRLETGWRANSRWLDRDLDAQRDATGRGTWLPSPLGNAFGFDEHVQAGYGVLTRTVRRLEVQGGLRAEYTGRVFALADARYPYDYFSLFPSAALSWGGTGATQLRLGYGRRIRRPGTGELNPFPQFFDAQNVFVGNPALRPEFTDAFEGGLTRTGRRGTLQLSPFFRRTTDVIRVEVEPDAMVDGRPVTTVSYLNLATSNSYGADVNGTLTAGRKLTAVTSFNVFRLVTDGGSASALASDALAWSARLNATWQATPGLAVQGTYFYRAPYAIERGRWAAFQTTTFVVRHKVRGDRGLVSLRVLDPFNTNRFAIRAGTERLLQLTAREPGVRGVFVGFQYNTGQAPRLRPVRQDPQPAPSTGFGP